MTYPIRVTVLYKSPSHAVMLSAIEQLSLEQHVDIQSSTAYKGKPRVLDFVLRPARGAKPFVLRTLRTLREYARIAYSWE